MAKKKYFFEKPNLSLVNKKAKNHRSLYHQAMHYAQYDITDKQLRKSIIAYAKDNELTPVFTVSKVVLADGTEKTFD